MKQHISVDQLNELSDKGKERLREWIWSSFDERPKEGFLVGMEQEALLLSIGQMIEFLDEKKCLRRSHWENNPFLRKSSTTEISWSYKAAIGSHDICDTLWEAVKQVLEENESD